MLQKLSEARETNLVFLSSQQGNTRLYLQLPTRRHQCGVNRTLAGPSRTSAGSSSRRHNSSYYGMQQKQSSRRCSSPLHLSHKEKKKRGEKNDILDVCHPSAETLCCRPPCVAVMSIYSAVIAARLPLSTIGHQNAAGIPSACFSQQMFSHYSPECKQWFRLFTFPPAGKRLLKSLITRQVSISQLLLQAG